MHEITAINYQFQMPQPTYTTCAPDPSLTVGVRTPRSSYTPQAALYAASYYCHTENKGGLAFEQRAHRHHASAIASALQLDEPTIKCPLCSVGVAVQRKEQSPEAADMN